MTTERERRRSGYGTVFYDASRECWVGQLPRDEVGRRPKVSAATEAEAHRKLYDLQRERDAGTLDAGRTTVGGFLKAWARDTLMLSDRAASTITKHEVAVRLHLVPALGRIKLAKLTPMHVQRFVHDKLDAGTGRSTVQQSLTTLRQALKQAVLWGLVPRNVAALVDGVPGRATERRPFTVHEQAVVLCFAEGDRLYPMIVVAQATGLRQSEVLGLRWADLDVDEGWLHLRRQLGRDGVLCDLKTPAARRSLPLPRHVVDVLQAHRAAQDAERAAAIYWEDHDLVLTTNTGRPVSQRNAHRSWTRILRLAGVEHRGIHHLRHAFVTALAERGVHERVAQHLAGHADSRMTRDIYTHVTRTMLDGATEAIEAAAQDVLDESRGSRNGSQPPDRER